MTPALQPLCYAAQSWTKSPKLLSPSASARPAPRGRNTSYESAVKSVVQESRRLGVELVEY